MENTWKLSGDTDIQEEIVKRFNIALSWLDLKRVQHPLERAEKNSIIDATSRKEKKFIPGWLNYQVTLKLVIQKRHNRVKMLFSFP